MNQPVFRQTSITPPAPNQAGSFKFTINIPQTYTPLYRNQQVVHPQAQIAQNRPIDYLNFKTQQSQSHIFSMNSDPPDQNRTLKLQSFARKGSFKEQNVSIQTSNVQKTRTNLSAERLINQRQVPSFITNANNNRSLHTSTLFISQENNVNRKKLEFTEVQPFIPFQKQKTKQSETAQMKLNNGCLQDRAKQNYQTDRFNITSSKTSGLPLTNNLKLRQFNSNQKSILKNNQTLLESTQNSSLSGSSCKQDQQRQESSTPVNPIKVISSVNFWPLSISPNEQKRQILGTLGMPQIITKSATEAKQRNQSCAEFKKKKPTEFSTQPISKQSNDIKSFTLQDFQLLDKIGKGAFGDVYMAQQKLTGLMVVIKKLLKKKIVEMKLEEHLLRQIKIQSFLKHRHLTSLYGFFSDSNYIYLILEIMPDGSLMQVKKKRKIPEAEVACYIKQICEGLKYMHTEEIIHRDIKPENIFLFEGYAKIGDFGCSIYTQSLRNTVIGSLAYISPEQLKQGSYDQKIDVWSLGVMTYEMLVGSSPYQEDIIKIAKHQIAPELSQLKFPAEIQLSSQAKNFLLSMLNLDPNKRIGIGQTLKHEFIQKNISKNEVHLSDKQ